MGTCCFALTAGVVRNGSIGLVLRNNCVCTLRGKVGGRPVEAPGPAVPPADVGRIARAPAILEVRDCTRPGSYQVRLIEWLICNPKRIFAEQLFDIFLGIVYCVLNPQIHCDILIRSNNKANCSRLRYTEVFFKIYHYTVNHYFSTLLFGTGLLAHYILETA